MPPAGPATVTQHGGLGPPGPWPCLWGGARCGPWVVASTPSFPSATVFSAAWGRAPCRAVESPPTWARLCARDPAVGGSVLGEIRRPEEPRLACVQGRAGLQGLWSLCFLPSAPNSPLDTSPCPRGGLSGTAEPARSKLNSHTTTRCHCAPLGMAKTQHPDNTRHCEAGGTRPSHHRWGSAEQSSHLGRQFGGFSQN